MPKPVGGSELINHLGSHFLKYAETSVVYFHEMESTVLLSSKGDSVSNAGHMAVMKSSSYKIERKLQKGTAQRIMEPRTME